MTAEQLSEALGMIGEQYPEEVLREEQEGMADAGSGKQEGRLPDGQRKQKQQSVTSASGCRKIKRRRIFLNFTTAAAAIVFLMCGTSVLALEAPFFYNLLYSVSPETARFFLPVQRSCEDNGIRMEVAAAYVKENHAGVTITMQDLTGSRIDETTDLFDSYSLYPDFGSSSVCHRIAYDEKTNTATFLIEIEAWEGQELQGEKMVFSVRELISGKNQMEDIPVGLDTASLSAKGLEAQEYYPGCFTGGGMDAPFSKDVFDELKERPVLKPGKSLFSPFSVLNITGAGYVDGMLHIQLEASRKNELDPHGFLYLEGEDGSRTDCEYTVCFAENVEDSEKRLDYQEFVFDVPREDIGSYRLKGSFYTASRNVKGDWRVSFSLKGE